MRVCLRVWYLYTLTLSVARVAYVNPLRACSLEVAALEDGLETQIAFQVGRR